MPDQDRLFKDPSEPPRDIWIHEQHRRIAEEGSVWKPPVRQEEEREPQRARSRASSAGKRKSVIA